MISLARPNAGRSTMRFDPLITPSEDFLKLRQIEGLNMLKLDLGHGLNVTFLQEWITTLKELPVDEYGTFMRDTIYPSLIAPDRRSWQRSQISNLDLQAVVLAYEKPAEEKPDPDFE